MIAVVVVRGGELPSGGDEAVAEAGGVALVIGDGTDDAVASLAGVATEVTCIEQEAFRPAGWAEGLAALVKEHHVVVLPASPDGRDLAPRLARALGRPLLAGALSVAEDGATVSRMDGRVTDDVLADGPFVATLIPGVRGVPVGSPHDDPSSPRVTQTTLAVTPDALDPSVVSVLAADPATMDLAEAGRIVAGGAGLGSATAFDALRAVGLAVGASMGATRVVADWGWVPFAAQIGTTGVSVKPHLYLAFGISGAVQHVAGLGQPDHIISVNVDRSCPMMLLADLAVVADAPAVLAAIAARVGVVTAPGGEDHAHG